MKTLKNHWPAILMILLTVGSIVSFQWALKNDGDLLSLSIFYFGLLVPACALVLCLWYGIRLDDRRKWLLPVACWAAPILMETISCLDLSLLTDWRLGLFSFFAGLCGILVGGGIHGIRERNRGE